MQYFNISDPAIKFRIVAQNDLAFALLNYQPIVPGHILICPIRPVATYIDGFNFAWNEGPDESNFYIARGSSYHTR